MRLVLVGAGPVGISAVEAAISDGLASGVRAVVDPDPAAIEAAAGLRPETSAGSVSHLDPAERGEVAVVAFSSSAEKSAEEIIRLVGAGYHVVTTCEELGQPSPHVRAGVETSAHSGRRVVIATGANPGFVMDRLPLELAMASRQVTSIRVTRVVDTSLRRGPLVEKTGRGLSPAAFEERRQAGTVGHIGLAASLAMLADGLDWQIHDVQEVLTPILGSNGRVSGIRQTASTSADPHGRIELELRMEWEAADPGDHIAIEGDPPLAVHIEGGYHGDRGTSAQVVRALALTRSLEPGFYRPIDLPLTAG